MELNWTNEDLEQCQAENRDLRDQIRHYEAEYKKLRAALDEERAKVKKLERVTAEARGHPSCSDRLIEGAAMGDYCSLCAALADLEATDE